MGIVRGGAALAVVGAIALAGAGCTTGDVAPGPSTAPPTAGVPTSEPATSDAPGSTLDAVITVASVDVDGVHATVSGYVSGLIEDGGACTFVLTGGAGDEVTAATVGIADRATTSCGAARVAVDRLGKGTWSVRLEYRSATTEVVSAESALEIP
jgi:hypothetical protein